MSAIVKRTACRGGEGATALLADPHVRGRRVESRRAEPEGERAAVDPAPAEHRQTRAKAVVLGADEVRSGHPAALEVQLSQLRGPHAELAHRPAAEAGRVAVDDEDRQPLEHPGRSAVRTTTSRSSAKVALVM
jgi:hypothetical protein